MSNIIVVTSNCVTAGLSTALQFLCPSYRIVPFPISDLENADKARNVLGAAAIWITAFHFDTPAKLGLDQTNPGLRVFKIPALSFAAFHPDICYVRNQNDNDLVMPHYNSRIGVWAYNRGLSVDQTLPLFSAEVFGAVGYLNRWDSEVQHLQRQFERTDLKNEFEAVHRRLRRMGCFMHSINHPRVELIIEIARAVARALQLPTVDKGAEILFSDVLDNVNWPIYPAIAESLGLSTGSYVFKLGERLFAHTLHAYLQYSFQNYQRLGAHPGQLKFEHSEPKGFSQALQEALATA